MGSQANSDLRRADGTKTRVLLVEDDFLVAGEIEHGLTQSGCEVVGIADTATEAESMARAYHPDVIVMDIRLKGTRDGVEAAIAIFIELGIRSLFATAHADDETRERAASAKPLGWLQKPYSSRELIRLIESILRT